MAEPNAFWSGNWPTFWAVLGTFPLLAFAVASAGDGHGNMGPLAVLFPIPLFAGGLIGGNENFWLVACLIQFPAYTLLLKYAASVH